MTVSMFKTNRTGGSYQACNLLHTTICYEHLMVICHLTLPILPLMLLPHNLLKCNSKACAIVLHSLLQ
ncbi:hypothetical protein ES319_A05G143800v1 [Gossypium barbadense]|uniref:Uncharacterized protein n=2 Tax=Gossypium TaxID=3633 RepID=A0A5J5VP89_GOSBA|nr:hypothetical protein ES319_A05G143800v1 [Gossypium barbadense]TYH16831.1 hypothetical protein ES288_A05G146600v1 [Gossypium darwinii]